MTNHNQKGFIPPFGGYRKLLTFQKAEIIYDGTYYFTKRFFDKYDRTVSQMVQAARSGKQNIAEASMASGTSKEMEIKLTNVARASLEELKIDYEDFLRVRGLGVWNLQHPCMIRFREANKRHGANYETFRSGIEHKEPAVCANTMICLINVTSYLLHKQIRVLEETFLREGGMREQMWKARNERKK